MTRRWQPGKRPTLREVKNVLTNAVSHFNLRNADLDLQAKAVLKFYEDRVEWKR